MNKTLKLRKIKCEKHYWRASKIANRAIKYPFLRKEYLIRIKDAVNFMIAEIDMILMLESSSLWVINMTRNVSVLIRKENIIKTDV